LDREDSTEPRQALLFEGDHGSTPFYTSREAIRFIRLFKSNQVPADLRAPYDDWARRRLAGGGVFLRATLSLRGDQMSLALVVQRGGRTEDLDAGDDALPVILLHTIPIFVEIKLLKDVGGWVEHPSAH
jgi:hypothetical protein